MTMNSSSSKSASSWRRNNLHGAAGKFACGAEPHP
jgi:hypothetical protein